MTNTTMPTYRCTRNEFSDIETLADRQGYYVVAADELEALVIMQSYFPSDTKGFTVEVWIIG